MHRPKLQPIRNKIDLADRVQVRIVTRRLGVSQAELVNLVDRIGNSIAAITKEVHLQRVGRPPQVDVPPAALIASVAGTETASGDPGAAAKPSG